MKTKKSAWVPLAWFLFAGALVAHLVGRMTVGDVSGDRSPLVGAMAPEFVGTSLSGDPIAMSDLRGKVVLLDFWASWCGPCLREVPHLKEVYHEFHRQGLEVIGVNRESRETLEQAVDKLDLPYTQIHDAEGEIGRDFGVTYIPQVFLIDEKGMVVRSDLRGRQIRTAVNDALSPPAEKAS